MQTPDAQSLADTQRAPTGRPPPPGIDAHWPSTQKPPAHWPGAVHDVPLGRPMPIALGWQTPATQNPLAQSEGEPHVAPAGRPMPVALDAFGDMIAAEIKSNATLAKVLALKPAAN